MSTQCTVKCPVPIRYEHSLTDVHIGRVSLRQVGAFHRQLHDSLETAYNYELLSPIITCYLALLRMTAFKYGCSSNRVFYSLLAGIMITRDKVDTDTGCNNELKSSSIFDYLFLPFSLSVMKI